MRSARVGLLSGGRGYLFGVEHGDRQCFVIRQQPGTDGDKIAWNTLPCIFYME